MEKAFDKMNRHALFIKLMKRGCPLTLINILNDWFEKSSSSVRWGDSLSDHFILRAGTRQGGVLSPLLFSIFINDLLLLLDNENCGCIINNISLNSFLYADDLILLSLSIIDMLVMLDVCKRELQWLDMTINFEKSSAMRIGERFDVPIPPLIVGGRDIQWVNSIRYLGVVLVAGKIFSICLHTLKIKFFQGLNTILGKIGDMSNIPLILSLASTNCFPILLYGLSACCLSNAQVASLEYAYNAVFVKVFKSFDKKVLLSCQYFTGILPVRYAMDLDRIKFLKSICSATESPAGFICTVAGGEEIRNLELTYGVRLPIESPASFKKKIWEKFGRTQNDTLL